MHDQIQTGDPKLSLKTYVILFFIDKYIKVWINSSFTIRSTCTWFSLYGFQYIKQTTLRIFIIGYLTNEKENVNYKKTHFKTPKIIKVLKAGRPKKI